MAIGFAQNGDLCQDSSLLPFSDGVSGMNWPFFLLAAIHTADLPICDSSMMLACVEISLTGVSEGWFLPLHLKMGYLSLRWCRLIAILFVQV